MRCEILLLLAASSFGCATIIHGTTQEVGSRSVPPGATVSVSGQIGTTPTKFTLSRGQGHVVVFSKEGYSDHQTYLKQLDSPFFGGNVLLGGIIGMAVDKATGSAYMLSPANVEMDMVSGTAREFKEEDKDTSSTVAAGSGVPPSVTPPAGAAVLMPNAPPAAPPRSAPVAPTPAASGTAGTPE